MRVFIFKNIRFLISSFFISSTVPKHKVAQCSIFVTWELPLFRCQLKTPLQFDYSPPRESVPPSVAQTLHQNVNKEMDSTSISFSSGHVQRTPPDDDWDAILAGLGNVTHISSSFYEACGWNDPLFRLIDEGDLPSAFDLLDENNVHMQDRMHRTLIYYACMNSDTRSIIALLEYGADMFNIKDAFGRDPLSYVPVDQRERILCAVREWCNAVDDDHLSASSPSEVDIVQSLDNNIIEVDDSNTVTGTTADASAASALSRLDINPPMPSINNPINSHRHSVSSLISSSTEPTSLYTDSSVAASLTESIVDDDNDDGDDKDHPLRNVAEFVAEEKRKGKRIPPHVVASVVAQILDKKIQDERLGVETPRITVYNTCLSDQLPSNVDSSRRPVIVTLIDAVDDDDDDGIASEKTSSSSTETEQIDDDRHRPWLHGVCLLLYYMYTSGEDLEDAVREMEVPEYLNYDSSVPVDPPMQHVIRTNVSERSCQEFLFKAWQNIPVQELRGDVYFTDTLFVDPSAAAGASSTTWMGKVWDWLGSSMRQ
eukprot:TRINITY_DN10146_c2_g2_i1.p1 TRINITY_DN10146_c2_g2~~TRINITY_DN10146_c2_g2_i1.p1  ORF type:complete len:541 (+),score=104.74 TRINITY_DN10146_c2_g2_i1:218-1840(+)